MRIIFTTVLFVAAAFACRTERLAVSLGMDRDAHLIDSTPQSTSIEVLASLPKPRKYPSGSRVDAVERATWEIRAGVRQFKQDPDGGYHVVVEDGRGHTMIVEIPAPACMKGSRFLKTVKGVRKHFEERFPRKSSKQLQTIVKPVQVIIHGVGFFDKSHEHAGSAPNGIELNPVTLMCFEDESCDGI